MVGTSKVSDKAIDQTEIPRARRHLFFLRRLRHFSQAGIPQAPLAEGNAKKYKAEVDNTITRYIYHYAYIYNIHIYIYTVYIYINIIIYIYMCVYSFIFRFICIYIIFLSTWHMFTFIYIHVIQNLDMHNAPRQLTSVGGLNPLPEHPRSTRFVGDKALLLDRRQVPW